jgi:hypothetical protein
LNAAVVPNQRTNTVLVTAVAGDQYLFHRSKRRTQLPTEPASLPGFRTKHASKTMNAYRTAAFHSNKFSHHPLLDRTATTSAILHCYFAECTWLTGAPKILVEPNSVAIWCVR